MINPFNFFRNKTAAARRRSAAPSGSSLFHAIRAHFIAADPAPKSSEWWRADNLTADADANPDVRRTLRMRSRFEIQNNPYARGMVQTVANDSIGSGPRLRFGSDDDDLNTRVERDFTAWSEMIRLATKLRTIRITRAADGEAFVMLANNPALHGPVKLDLQLIDADRVTGDDLASLSSGVADSLGGEPLDKPIMVDGIIYDRYGNARSYRVLRNHPESSLSGFSDALIVPAKNMMHIFRQDRPEQHRGVPELVAALPLFAQLRRYTNAVVESAAQASSYGGILYTDKPENDQAAKIEPMDAVELDMNHLTTMPEGWKMDELYVKTPIATYADFKKEILSELGSAFGVPYAIVTGTSAGYTYASAKLDHQTYFRSIWTERTFVEDQILNRLFIRWFREWCLAHPEVEISDAMTPWHGHWIWPHTDDLDLVGAAKVQELSLKNNTTTLAHEYARQGKNWKTELEQIKKEREYVKELGL